MSRESISYSRLDKVKRCHSKDAYYCSKNKKRHGRDSSQSSDSTASSCDSVHLLKRLEHKRSKAIVDKRCTKERMKANETPEQKRLRRLLKKEKKERKRKERMGWDTEYLHYTNTDNPFGDANLLSTFVWKKKLLREGMADVSQAELERRTRTKQEENRRELEKVKKRRIERELERQQREEELQLCQRSKEAAQFEEWQRQEDKFHLDQARLRSEIRIAEGRAKPIDLLAKYVQSESSDVDIEVNEPYTYLIGLNVIDLEDLIEDIKVYQEMEHGRNHSYWTDIIVIAEDELQKQRKVQHANDQLDMGVGRREGINQAVANDVTSIFKGKSAQQLVQLRQQIENKIRNKSAGIDISYWESLLSQIKAYVAKARLMDRHHENLRKKLQVLKADEMQDIERANSSNVKYESTVQNSVLVAENNDASLPAKLENTCDHFESVQMYCDGNYSPKYVDMENDSRLIELKILSEEDDREQIIYARNTVRERIVASRSVAQPQVHLLSKDEQLMREAKRGMDADEAPFSVESPLDNQVYLWCDKYRPRKPRYFNRVHTGFEWNKYNQTHYDMDNPPPKIVQGYKFNIFYPDLIEKQDTPEYALTACNDNKEFAVIRFHAGPPYEDIAFKIVNREWEYSYKRGFRCQFQNNIFQLWFHFKRYRYRR